MFWVTKNLATSSMSEFEYRKPKDVVVVDVRELIDGEGNDEAVFKKLVDRADKYIKSGKRVCICCVGGQSRSNAVALGF